MCFLGNYLNCRVLVLTCAYDSCFAAKAADSLCVSLHPVWSRLRGLLYTLSGRHTVEALVAAPRHTWLLMGADW